MHDDGMPLLGDYETVRPPRVFLGGPFSAALRSTENGEIRFTDSALRSRLEAMFAAIRRSGAELLNAHLADGWAEGDFGTSYSIRDVRWAEACDVFVAYLPNDPSGQPYRTDGTFVELGTALAARKRVILLMDSPESQAWSWFVRDLAKSGLVEIAKPDAILNDPEGLLLNGLLKPNSNARHRITDVRLWNWFQRGSKVPMTVSVGQANLVVYPGVMNPRFSHSPDFLMSFWKIPTGAKVLDMGCGCGVAGINALLAGAGQLVAVDLNPEAIKNTTENLRLNNLTEKGVAKVSDAFSAVTGTFDVVLFNPPYWGDKPATNMLERASFDTPGHGFLCAVMEGLREHLTPSGRCFLGFADQGDLTLVTTLISRYGLKTQGLFVQRPDRPGFHVRVGWEISR